MAAAAALTSAKAQAGAQLQLNGPLCQGLFAHKRAAQATELALVAVWEAPVELGRDGQVEHGVAQELQPIIVGLRDRRPLVGEGGVGIRRCIWDQSPVV